MLRQCPHCGAHLDDSLAQCPHCREDLAPPAEVHVYRPGIGRAQMRRGMLYMWLSAIFYYFAAGYSGLHLPFAVPSALTEYLLPFLFLAGTGMLLYGIFLRLRS
jgi:hypothetical protein